MIIGIDPDLVKSGVAIITDKMTLHNLTFPELMQLFSDNKDQIKKVVIEAGWLNVKSNFHARYGQSKSAGERIAKNVGENHATGKLIAEMAEYYNLNVILVKPTKKKYTAEEFNRLTGWVGRSNQEQRDAGALVFGMK